MKRNKQMATKENYRLFVIFLSLSILVFGLYQIRHVVQTDKQEYSEIKQIALTAAVMMHYEDLLKLKAVPEDTLKVEYDVIKEMLAGITKANTTAVFAYVYTIRNGKVLFMADSEPKNSPDCSPAGQELTEATDLDKRLMDEGSVPVIEFSEDRWGDWVSVLIPLKHPVTHRIFAVFGMDFDAKVWKAKKRNELLLGLLIVILSLFVLTAIFRIISNNRKLKRDFELLKKTETELLVAKEKAEESDRLKTSFLKNISHEIRTPMNSILGFAGLLKEQDLSAEYKELYLLNMINSGQRMLNTIYDIIDLSRVQSGQISATIARANMGEELFGLQDIYLETAKEKGLEFRCLITQDAKDLFFYTDTALLQVILRKLLWNAFKFTTKGYVEVGYQIKGDQLEFFVKDSGVGVEEVQKTFIFEYFRQGNDSLNRNHEGNGLGLTIAKAYVEILGGKIWVESNEGNGSIFKFTIPFHLHAPESSI